MNAPGWDWESVRSVEGVQVDILRLPAAGLLHVQIRLNGHLWFDRNISRFEMERLDELLDGKGGDAVDSGE